MKLQCDEHGNPIKQRLGSTIAHTTGGFGFDGHIDNFDFNLFFNYSLGNKLINGTKLMSAFYANSSSGYSLNDDFALSKRYTLVDPETGLNLVKPSSWSTLLNTYGGENGVIRRLNQMNAHASIYNPATVTTMQLTDYAVEDASFLRLNNLTIGYTLPQAWTKKCLLENVRVYFTGYNLFVITSYSGADPEVDTSSKRNLMTPGIDYAAYPKSRLFLAGINVTF
ncbi:protein containing TonB-dependent receptor, beta-barrel domain protein [gut metagenome]|uniref:Protein containing TonB-dependent receptor, beta-barrel domain protein n=1 Tax=gut metagenome TaxID=749906 RepID=J9GNL2_9ZZZZ